MSAMPASPSSPPAYPATLSIDYPDRELNRLTSFFRIFVIVPIAIVLGSITGGSLSASWGHWNSGAGASAGITFLTFPLVLMILFRQKYPRWWFDWNLQLSRFSYRVASYFLLMTDVYPSTDEEQGVHLSLVYPDAKKDIGRGWPLIKWFLAIPHFIILAFLYVAAFFIEIVAWFAILFTGRFPRSLFDFTQGVLRWQFRVLAYAALLVTDKYPPFSFD